MAGAPLPTVPQEVQLERWHRIFDAALGVGQEPDVAAEWADRRHWPKEVPCPPDLAGIVSPFAPPKDAAGNYLPLPPPSGPKIRTVPELFQRDTSMKVPILGPARCADCERQHREGVRMLLHDPATPIVVSTMGEPDCQIPNFLDVFLTSQDLERAAIAKHTGARVLEVREPVTIKMPNGKIVTGYLECNGIEIDVHGNELAHYVLVAR